MQPDIMGFLSTIQNVGLAARLQSCNLPQMQACISLRTCVRSCPCWWCRRPLIGFAGATAESLTQAGRLAATAAIFGRTGLRITVLTQGTTAMTDDEIVLSSLLEKSSDACFLREMIGFAALRLMQQETEAICNAAPGERSADRRNQRNSYRDRETRTGTVELRIPELRRGSYFPAFLEPRRMAEKGSAVSTCDLSVPRVQSAVVVALLSVAAHSHSLLSGRTTAAI